MKRVISKIVKSSPFVEHRFQSELLKNEHRRADDISQENITEIQVTNSTTYKIAAGNLKSSNNKCPGGTFLDYYA
jgi:hypothetical protein